LVVWIFLIEAWFSKLIGRLLQALFPAV